MTIRGHAHIAGVYEHPGRKLPDHSVAELHAEVALHALADAGLTLRDVDAYYCDSSVPGSGPLSMVEYLGIDARVAVSNEIGGATYLSQVAHAAAAMATGQCRVALITMADRAASRWSAVRPRTAPGPEAPFEEQWGITHTVHNYALVAMRHMYQYGTTSAQLAEVKATASRHAQHNPNAALPDLVSVDDVLASPMVSSPLHRLDCCMNTDGGGAVVLVSGDVARELPRSTVAVLGHGEAHKNAQRGRADLTFSPAAWSGPLAFASAGVTPADIDYASVYDSFTITVITTLEDLGFCAKGEGGRFVMDGGLLAPHGRLPLNTDGGGLCNNHPGGRGGMPRMIEAVRQLRGEASPAVQVPNCELALVHGTGGRLGTRSSGATLVLGRAS
jgi:acetyl-CoA C-acetyltransferase